MTGYILSVVLTSVTCTDSGHVMYNTAIPVMKFGDTKLDRLLPMSATPVSVPGAQIWKNGAFVAK